MRRGQITLFMIAGIMVILTVAGAVWFLSKASTIESPDDVVLKDDTLARGCLQRATIQVLEDLKDDGVITVSEGGVLLDGPHPYLTKPGPASLEVENNYWGLCDTQLQNARQRDGSFSCDWRLYNLFQEQSIQSQLQTALNRHMNACLQDQQPGLATVVIRDEGIITTWNNPEVQYTHSTPLHLVHTALQEMLVREVTEGNFHVGNTPLTCDKCDAVTRTVEPINIVGGIPADYINVTLEVDGDIVQRIAVPRRDVALVDELTNTIELASTTITCGAGGGCDRLIVPLDDTDVAYTITQSSANCQATINALSTSSGAQTISVNPGINGQTVQVRASMYGGATTKDFAVILAGQGGSCP